MFIKIEAEKAETQPQEGQYVAFKSGSLVFAGIYKGDHKASPFVMSGGEAPVFLIEEWFPIRLWQ